MQITIFDKTGMTARAKKIFPFAEKVIVKALGRKTGKGEVNLIFVNGPEIRKINKRFLRKDRVTDVIAFSYTPCGLPARVTAPFGDIIVCATQAARQAKTTLARELLLLSAHGALHLAGRNDNTAAKRLAMHKTAEKIVGGIYAD